MLCYYDISIKIYVMVGAATPPYFLFLQKKKDYFGIVDIYARSFKWLGFWSM